MAIASPKKLLKSAYEQLGYSEGPLFEGASDPNNLSKKDWIEKGLQPSLVTGNPGCKVLPTTKAGRIPTSCRSC